MVRVLYFGASSIGNSLVQTGVRTLERISLLYPANLRSLWYRQL